MEWKPKKLMDPKTEALSGDLFTTHCVENLEDAFRIIHIYQQRWYIEQVFRLLKKKGFAIESSEVTTNGESES